MKIYLAVRSIETCDRSMEIPFYAYLDEEKAQGECDRQTRLDGHSAMVEACKLLAITRKYYVRSVNLIARGLEMHSEISLEQLIQKWIHDDMELLSLGQSTKPPPSHAWEDHREHASRLIKQIAAVMEFGK